MLKASFDTKCLIFSIDTFSHSNPSLEHLLTASSFFVNELKSFTVFDPQDGHLSGKINFFAFVSLFSKLTEMI